VRTYDPCDEARRTEVLDRIDELVVKPRSGFGGHGVVVGRHAESGDVRSAARALAERPEDFVAQELVMLSTHPTSGGTTRSDDIARL
jgi:glutamate---cysteine ligase / carboxylate-amine ligase